MLRQSIMRLAMVLLVTACDAGVIEDRDAPSPLPSIVADVAQQAQLISVIADAARDFAAWPRIDDRLRAAPIPCTSGFDPVPPAEVAPALSAASDGAHARKLFYLRTKDADVYTSDDQVPAGFVIVKESFTSVAVAPPPSDCNTRTGPYCMHAATAVDVDGQRLRAGAANGLFVMAKVTALAGTDEHWIYGTVSTEGAVTSAGRVASCMKCHEDATHERLFGVN